jgi:riboflavin kinase/FMN adenylyltransferase
VSGAVAVGVFDGVHLGHLRILERMLERARALGGPGVVVSFDPHPDVVLSRSFQALAPLTPLPEKRARLESLGVARLEVLPFTRELAALSPEAFVERHLVKPLAPQALVVGENFALGRGRAGDVPRLREIGLDAGFEVEAVPLLQLEGAAVTSTRIRELLARGEVAGAARLLGRRYGLEATVVTGEGMGRQLGFPTANLRLHDEKLVPAHGIYAVWVRYEGEAQRRPGAMSIGVRPTFGGKVPTLEVHVLDWSGDLVGRSLEVEFDSWLREERRFDGADPLIEAMREDVSTVRQRLASAPTAGTPGGGPRV